MKRILQLGTAAVLLSALITPASPARADNPGYLAFPRLVANMPAAWHVLNRKLWVDGCEGCPGVQAIDLTEYPSLSPRSEDAHLDSLTAGLAYLHDAAGTADPHRQRTLRTAAAQSFANAAWRLGRSRVSLGRVGTGDLTRNVFSPTRNPWLSAAGTDLADGLGLMGSALPAGYDGSDYPPPPPWRNPIVIQAMAQFDEAYTELVEQRPVGD
ncbi:hypothetical protein AB0K48_40565 [Nonomuraea sp. NPDC055795]